MAVEVVDGERFLEEEDVEALELTADLESQVARVRLVGVDDEVDVGSELVTGCGERLEVVAEIEANLHLDRAEALVHEAPSLRGRVLRSAPVDGARVDGNGVVDGAAEEVVHGRAEHFPLDVPEGDVDRREDRDSHSMPAVHAHDRPVVEVVPQVLDPARILADEDGSERPVDECRDRAEIERRTSEGTGADPRDPLVGRDLDERGLPCQLQPSSASNPVLLRNRAVHEVRLDVGNPHCRTVR
jgi:hypothetical protein